MIRSRIVIFIVHQRVGNLHLGRVSGGDEPVSVHKAVRQAAAECEGGVGPFGGRGVVGHLLLQRHAAFHGAFYS